MQSIYLRSRLVELHEYIMSMSMNTLYSGYNIRNKELVTGMFIKLSGGKIQRELQLIELL